MTAIPLADARDEWAFGGKAVQLGAAIRAGLLIDFSDETVDT